MLTVLVLASSFVFTSCGKKSKGGGDKPAVITAQDYHVKFGDTQFDFLKGVAAADSDGKAVTATEYEKIIAPLSSTQFDTFANVDSYAEWRFDAAAGAYYYKAIKTPAEGDWETHIDFEGEMKTKFNARKGTYSKVLVDVCFIAPVYDIQFWFGDYDKAKLNGMFAIRLKDTDNYVSFRNLTTDTWYTVELNLPADSSKSKEFGLAYNLGGAYYVKNIRFTTRESLLGLNNWIYEVGKEGTLPASLTGELKLLPAGASQTITDGKFTPSAVGDYTFTFNWDGIEAALTLKVLSLQDWNNTIAPLNSTQFNANYTPQGAVTTFTYDSAWDAYLFSTTHSAVTNARVNSNGIINQKIVTGATAGKTKVRIDVYILSGGFDVCILYGADYRYANPSNPSYKPASPTTFYLRGTVTAVEYAYLEYGVWYTIEYTIPASASSTQLGLSHFGAAGAYYVNNIRWFA